MRIHNLYEDANGESHFRDIEVDWVEETSTGKLSKRLPATGIMFRETTTDYENSWHRAPRRQYVISLGGGISITASDGETRHIGAGEIVLVEDTGFRRLQTFPPSPQNRGSSVARMCLRSMPISSDAQR